MTVQAVTSTVLPFLKRKKNNKTIFGFVCAHDLSDGCVLASRTRGEAVEHDGVARLEGDADEVNENER